MHLNLFYLLKDTIGTTNDSLVRKNPILHKEFLVHDSETAQAAGNIARRLRRGTPIGYISMLLWLQLYPAIDSSCTVAAPAMAVFAFIV